MDDILVLCYHAVSESWRSALAVTPQALERQLRRLCDAGYRGARFSDAVTGGSGKRLVVTFDDAYRSVLRLALPVLERLGLPATVFVPTGFASGDQLASWAGMEAYLRGPHAQELAVMSWEELVGLAGNGWEIGSHSHSHPHLPALDDDELADELVRSRGECEERIGTPCRSLAYPYGDTDVRVMAAAAQAGYTSAAGLPVRRFHTPLPLNWPRVGVYGSDQPWRLALKTSALVRRIRTIAGVPGPVPQRVARVPAAAPRLDTGARLAVIVPCHNDGDLVAEAVASIDEAEPVEVVVVDDASSEPSTAVALERLPGTGIRVIRHERNLGLPAARMTGLRATSARYVFPLDADDLAIPGALASMADLLDASPDLAACFGDYAEFGTRERTRRVPARLDPYRVAYRNDYPVSSLFRRSAIEAVGGWQPVGNEIGYEDWNLWMSLAERGLRAEHWGRGVAVRRRLHGQRMLSQAAKRHLTLYGMLRTLHPQLFGDLRAHRRQSDLGMVRRWLYPIVFGWRPPLSLVNRAVAVGSAVRAPLQSRRVRSVRTTFRPTLTGPERNRVSSQRSNRSEDQSETKKRGSS